MGYNAGGYGAMTFPSVAACDAWRASTVSHAAYDDWIDELTGAYRPDQTVNQRLAALAKAHDPKRYALYEIAVDATRVDLTFDVSENEFRDSSSRASPSAAISTASRPHSPHTRSRTLTPTDEQRRPSSSSRGETSRR